MNLCWYCGTEATVTGKIARKEICPKCKMSVKCCRNCGLFDASAPKQCREPAAEHISDKEGSNFCEYFEFLERSDQPGRRSTQDSKKKFDSLFKK